MHKIYTSQGLVLSSRGVGEKNILVTIFSRGLGIVNAKAISARMAKGKLKGHIVPYSLGTYTFVRGKEGWRLIQANAEFNTLNSLTSLNKKKIFIRTIKLVQKMSGFEPEVKLFDCLISAFDALVVVDEYLLKTFEAVLVARVLFFLGYMSFSELPESLNNFDNFSDTTLIELKHHLKDLVIRINEGLQESQLS